MAEIVLALATSHSPQLSVPWTHWKVLQEKDETDPRLDYQGLLKRASADIGRELTEEKWRGRDEACQEGIEILGNRLRETNPDVVVVLGDDQHEQFLDDNLPTFAVYHGSSLNVVKHEITATMAGWKAAEQQRWADTSRPYKNESKLAEHVITHLSEHEFDIARSNRLREGVGIGHAFSFLYRRLWPGSQVPMVPVMVNTYYPPNQPTPKRCYMFGRALRNAIETWDAHQRVAVMASGGLSHVVIDEELDRITIEALQQKDAEVLFALPRAKLCGGTSEILNWVALAGLADPMDLTLVDYVPTYRSPAGTGCGMCFAYWT